MAKSGFGGWGWSVGKFLHLVRLLEELWLRRYSLCGMQGGCQRYQRASQSSGVAQPDGQLYLRVNDAFGFTSLKLKHLDTIPGGASFKTADKL